jgi:hypothetical protein
MSKHGQILAWGISCKVRDEQKMGTALAALSMLGAFDIAWEAIRAKDPNAIERGKLGAAARLKKLKKSGKGKKGNRPSSVDTANKFLEAQKGQFKAKALSEALEKTGYSATSAYPILNYWINEKRVRRLAPGLYQTISVVKAA